MLKKMEENSQKNPLPPKKRGKKSHKQPSMCDNLVSHSFIFTVLISGYDTKMSCCYGFRISVDTHSRI